MTYGRKRYRPIRVRWFDGRWAEYVGRAYTDEKGARELAQRMADDGAIDVALWHVNEHGEAIGKIERIWPATPEPVEGEPR